VGFVEEGLESLAGVFAAVCTVFRVLFQGAGSHLAVLDVPEGASILNRATVAVDVLQCILPTVNFLESIAMAPLQLTFKHDGPEVIVVVLGGFIDVTIGADDPTAPYYSPHHYIVNNN